MLASGVNREFVLTKCDYFVGMQVWPLAADCDPHGWLRNFPESEVHLAAHLLNAFMYFRQPLIDRLFLSAFQQLSRDIVRDNLDGRDSWREFVDKVIVSRVTGEEPSQADSGYQYVRLARQVLGLAETQLMSPEEALVAARQDNRPIVFVDDFAGSGEQFNTMWHRDMTLGGHSLGSYAYGLPDLQGPIFYCPIICTSYGKDRIDQACSGVVVAPTHLLSARYGAFDPESLLWPEDVREAGREFIKTASHRAGIPDDQVRGFHELGLALAFEHFTVPDATLPLFYWEENGWIPLVRSR